MFISIQSSHLVMASYNMALACPPASRRLSGQTQWQSPVPQQLELKVEVPWFFLSLITNLVILVVLFPTQNYS